MNGSNSHAQTSGGQPRSCSFGRTQNASLAVTDVVTFLIGQPVISRLLWLALTSRREREVLNVNLAVFHNVQYLMSVMHLISMFAMPRIQMKVLGFLIVYAELGGPLNLCAVCLQRYVAVIHPTLYPLMKKYRCRELWAAAVWLLSVPIALASVCDGDAMSSVREDMINSVSFAVTVSIVLLIARVSARIALTLRKSGPGGDGLSPAKRRAFTTVCATSATALCFYIPVALLQKCRTVDEYVYECVVTPVCILLLSLSSVVHPLFYLHVLRARKTRRGSDGNTARVRATQIH